MKRKKNCKRSVNVKLALDESTQTTNPLNDDKCSKKQSTTPSLKCPRRLRKKLPLRDTRTRRVRSFRVKGYTTTAKARQGKTRRDETRRDGTRTEPRRFSGKKAANGKEVNPPRLELD